jgi:hypothetical protein
MVPIILRIDSPIRCAQIHRGLRLTMSIGLLNFELHAGNHALSITLRASYGLPKPGSNFSTSRSVPDNRGLTTAAWITIDLSRPANRKSGWLRTGADAGVSEQHYLLGADSVRAEPFVHSRRWSSLVAWSMLTVHPLHGMRATCHRNHGRCRVRHRQTKI